MNRTQAERRHRTRNILSVSWLKLLSAVIVPLGLSAAERPVPPIPTYEVQLAVECASPEAAAKAELEFLPLPPGKSVAFSCRWDDSNPRHLKMKELMKKHGYKGTFYLTLLNRDFQRTVLPELCKDGFTIGNHTWSHTYLPLLTPNGVHYEMLAARILHESLSDQTETAFIFPFGRYQWKFYPDAPDVISSCLRRTGALGGPDGAMTKLNKRPDSEFFNTEGRDIRPGDRDTREEKFDAHVRRALPKEGETAHLTLGVHTWHSDADFLTLEKSLQKYANRPDWWYCNENEFLACSYLYRHTRIVGKKTEGSRAVFTLEMPCPEHLGSDTPLWAKCAGKTIEIRHTRKLPVRIRTAEATGVVPDFPDLEMKLAFPAPDRVRFDAVNRGAALKDVSLILRLPPDFVEETLTCHVDEIAGNFSKEWRVTPVAAGPSAGQQLTALQCDFTRDGAAERIWVTHLRKIKPAGKAAARIRCFAKPLEEEEATRLSCPAAEPKPGLFVPVEHRPEYRESIFHIPAKLRSKNGTTVLMDFSGGQAMILRGDDLPSVVYCNGEKLTSQKGELKFAAPAGNCRLLLVYGKSSRPRAFLQLLLTPAGQEAQ